MKAPYTQEIYNITIGVVGRKYGMTRISTEEGVSIPITVIEVEPDRVTQFEAKKTDGYRVVQVTTGKCRASRVIRAQAGHSVKANVAAGRGAWEFRLGEEQYTAGDQVTVDLFRTGQMVDVIGESKGKGSVGTIKHWNFRGQDNTYGNSVSYRVSGSTGQCQTPGRVFRGKKVSGCLGVEWVTVQSLGIVRVDAERNLLLVKDAVPGATGDGVIVRPAAEVRG